MKLGIKDQGLKRIKQAVTQPDRRPISIRSQDPEQTSDTPRKVRHFYTDSRNIVWMLRQMFSMIEGDEFWYAINDNGDRYTANTEKDLIEKIESIE